MYMPVAVMGFDGYSTSSSVWPHISVAHGLVRVLAQPLLLCSPRTMVLSFPFCRPVEDVVAEQTGSHYGSRGVFKPCSGAVPKAAPVTPAVTENEWSLWSILRQVRSFQYIFQQAVRPSMKHRCTQHEAKCYASKEISS